MIEENFYNQFIGLFVTVEYCTPEGSRLAKGILKSVDGSKLFIEGDYNKFILDTSQIINISGREDKKNGCKQNPILSTTNPKV